MEEKKKKKKKTFTWLKVTLTQEKKFSNTKPCRLFTNFTILISSFYLVLLLHLFHYFLIFILYHYLHHFHYL